MSIVKYIANPPSVHYNQILFDMLLEPQKSLITLDNILGLNRAILQNRIRRQVDQFIDISQDPETLAVEQIFLNYLSNDGGYSLYCQVQDYVANHTIAMLSNAGRLSERLGVPPAIPIGMALLHDIGKLKIDPEVVLFRGKYNNVQYAEMQEHTWRGIETFCSDPDVINLPAHVYRSLYLAILAHHQHFDGRGGYPLNVDHFSGEYSLPLDILRVVDSVDAMLNSDRDFFRPPQHTLLSCMSELQTCQNRQFSPQVVEAACELFKENKLDVPDEWKN